MAKQQDKLLKQPWNSCIKAFKGLSITSMKHAWQKYIRDPSDEERTNNQGYFTQLATHVLIINKQ